jgi:cytochrome c553
MKLNLPVVVASSLLIAVAGLAHADGDAAAGKTKSTQCASCHGANGKGGGANPAIAGLDKAKFLAAIADFKSGKRNNPMMGMMAKKLSDQDAADLAAYYSALK